MPFRDITGHRRLLELLARSVERNSLPPSLILEGPEGASTRDTAIALAQALNCSELRTENLELRTVDACGVCVACNKIARGVHPDVLIVEPGDSGTIKVEQVREIVDRAGYRPFEGKRRVVIVDHADALVAAAQNALLKTLEEPPSSSVFLLLTSRPDMLLPTVRSRCIRLRFVEPADVEIDEEARDDAGRVLMDTARAADAGARLESARDLLPNPNLSSAEQREHVAARLRAMESLLRDVELLATRADERVLVNPDVRPALERLTQAYAGERGVRAFTAIDQALMALDRNAGVKVVADWLVLHL
jgi:DNA polymerase III subunit delta'